MNAAILLASYLLGTVPFSYAIARRRLGVDLRTAGTGTVTPTNLWRVGGLPPAIIAGALEVAKGAIGPALIGTDHRMLAAVAGALTITGHNWSPFLRGGGGRGISPATGALWVVAWPGAVFLGGWLLAGATAGWLSRRRDTPRGGTPRPIGIGDRPDRPGDGLSEHAEPGRERRGRRDRVLPAMRLGLFLLLPFLVLVRGLDGLLTGLILLAPIGFKTTHEISRRQLLRRYLGRPDAKQPSEG